MADLLRLVEVDPATGRPWWLQDLNSETTGIVLMRDTFAVTPPPKQPVLVTQQGRYSGQRTVGETHGNGQIGGTFWVQGSSPADATAKIEALLRDLDEPSRQRYVQWQPDGMAQAVLYELRGPATVAVRWKALIWAQRRVVQLELAMPVAPLARGLSLTVTDHFASIDSQGRYAVGGSVTDFSDWTVYAGAGTVWRNGSLAAQTDTVKTMVHTARGYAYSDCQVDIGYHVRSGDLTPDVRAILRAADASNYLYAGTDGAGQLRIYKHDSGVTTALAGPTAHGALADGALVLIRFRAEGNDLALEWFAGTNYETPTATPTATVTHTLSGADATKFGAGVSGKAGLYWDPVGTDPLAGAVVGWRVRPYVYRARTTPLKVALSPPIPGSASAECAVEIAIGAPAALPKFGLIALDARGDAALGGAVPLAVLQDSDGASVGGISFSTTADGSALGGTYLGHPTPTAGAYAVEWALDLASVAGDDFSAGTIAIEVWGRWRLDNELVTPTVVASARPAAFAFGGGGDHYTQEYGSVGRRLPIPAATSGVWRFVRLGTIVFTRLPGPRVVGHQWVLRVAATLGGGTAGAAWGIDYVVCIPVRSRAVSPTDRGPSGYPAFVSAAQSTKRIAHDLRGGLLAAPSTHFREWAPMLAVGLGGFRLEPPPGDTDLLVKLSDLIPGDPTVDTSSEGTSVSASLHVDVTPRHRLVAS